MPVVQVPTTLVAQVDSAYGGKTGVDLPRAKNYVGAYHQPAGVLVDPDTLANAARARARGGLGRGAEDGADRRRRAVGRAWAPARISTTGRSFACARTKLAVVAADERDGGRRQVLNLGHTIGHAIETATRLRALPPRRGGGARPARGAAPVRAPSELREQVRELLLARELPVTLQGIDVEQVVLAARARQEARGRGSCRSCCVAAPGQAQIGCEVSQAELEAAVAELVQPR